MRSRCKPVASSLASTTTLSALALLAVACGGAPPPPPAAPPPPAPIVQVAPPPPVDLSPVPDPPALVASGRIGKLSASLAIARAWTKLPMPQSEQVTELLTSEAVGPLVDLDQPIDFAVGVLGEGSHMHDVTALSAALKDPEHAKAVLSERYKLVPGDNGALLIQGLGKTRAAGPSDDEDDKPSSDDHDREAARVCEVAPAFGAAPVRLVCGLDAKGLQDLGPWLLRTATRATISSDLHVDLRMAPLQRTIASQKFLLSALFTSVLGSHSALGGLREVVAAAGGDAIDFAQDLDGAALDLSLTDKGARVAVTTRFAGATSTLARLATAHPERTGAAPAAFWQLPGDAEVAFFGRGIDEAQLARPRDLLLQAVGQTLGNAGLKDADRKAIVDGLGKLVSPAAAVYASGVDAEAARRAVAADRALTEKSDQAEKDQVKHQAIEELLGWRVVELDEASTRMASGLKELSAALGRASVAAAYRETLKAPPPSLRSLPVPRSAGLPAGTQHYVLELHTLERKAPPPPRPGAPKPPPAKPLPPLKPVALHFFLIAEGGRTWLGIGGDDAVVAAHLAAALGSAGDKLATRSDLAPLKEAVGAGGFVTPRAVLGLVQQGGTLLDGAIFGARQAFSEAEQMPHRGMTAVSFSSTAQAASTPATTVTRIDVPREAVDDAVATILRRGGL